MSDRKSKRRMLAHLFGSSGVTWGQATGLGRWQHLCGGRGHWGHAGLTSPLDTEGALPAKMFYLRAYKKMFCFKIKK